MSPACFALCFLSFLLCIFPNIFFSSALHLPLTQFHTTPSRDPYQTLNHLVSSSLRRAHHLKNPRPTATKAGRATPATSTPLFSHSYGGYSISLSFGTPPQTLPFVMDTGSDIVWFPCTHRYLCKNCSFSSSSPSKNDIPSFIPKQSSSSRIIGCKNPKCSWIHHTNRTQCGDECENSPVPQNCTQSCPPYIIFYGSGTTGGIALSENLNLGGDKTVRDFLVGCSVFSSRQPAGIAGFGRGLPSLPSQLKLDKFSYCLISHRFDDSASSSALILDSNSDLDKKTSGLTYTPFLQNPIAHEAFKVYYYIGLRKISVGGRRVKVPYKYLSPGEEGNGGAIVDSGTTFSFMARQIFEPVAAEFVKQVKNYSRAREVENLTGLRPCYDVKGRDNVEFPEMRLHLKGGAEVALPLENYFAAIDGGAACLTFVTDDGVGGQTGPAVILGNFQMQNYYLEYDLRNERLGFKQQLCI
ncbi:Peptidase A1 [Corchorus olitorius]|uniref:Peptidase A1 n=1 Tax=Corchorus olitorius TaxID=93759 RepID=A0A1R3IKT9_9ROSI|nr:Peptidase A1 [Corchorus olitorius]